MNYRVWNENFDDDITLVGFLFKLNLDLTGFDFLYIFLTQGWTELSSPHSTVDIALSKPC